MQESDPDIDDLVSGELIEGLEEVLAEERPVLDEALADINESLSLCVPSGHREAYDILDETVLVEAVVLLIGSPVGVESVQYVLDLQTSLVSHKRHIVVAQLERDRSYYFE